MNAFNLLKQSKLHTRCRQISFLATLIVVCTLAICQRFIGTLDILLPSRISDFWSEADVTHDSDAWSRVGFIWPDMKRHLGVRVYSNVCIEWSEPRSAKFPGIYYKQHQKVVVYNASQVDASANHTTRRKSDVLGWNIEFTNASIPTSTHTLIAGSVAFVSRSYNIGNMFHFWAETFLPLFSVVNTTGRLHSAARNYLFYAQPYHLLAGGLLGENNVARFDKFYDSLYMNRSSPRTFWQLKNNTCFAYAVFGYTSGNNDERKVIEHVVQSLLYGSQRPQQQPRLASRFVTIVQRRWRKLLNAEEMAAAARGIGFRNVRVITFDHMSVKEQMKIAVETCVMVGVAGAGLQWGIFMQPNTSTVVELSWPQLGFGFFFERIMPRHNIRTVKLKVYSSAMRLNWDSYDSVFNRTTSRDQRFQLLMKFPPNPHQNPWKYADATVNIKQFIQVLTKCRC